MNDMQHNRRTARPDCQVLVVGAGPTGLVLAADLLARGVSTRIIDKSDGVNLETRAIAIHARGLALMLTSNTALALRRVGLDRAVIDRGMPAP